MDPLQDLLLPSSQGTSLAATEPKGSAPARGKEEVKQGEEYELEQAFRAWSLKPHAKVPEEVIADNTTFIASKVDFPPEDVEATVKAALEARMTIQTTKGIVRFIRRLDSGREQYGP